MLLTGPSHFCFRNKVRRDQEDPADRRHVQARSFITYASYSSSHLALCFQQVKVQRGDWDPRETGIREPRFVFAGPPHVRKSRWKTARDLEGMSFQHPNFLEIMLYIYAQKADIDSAFRRIPIRPDHRMYANVAFKHNDQTFVAQHLSIMFGSSASVHHWERVGESTGSTLV